MTKPLKHALLGGARKAGLFAAVRESEWRRRRLLILCYHGISLDDEHRWNPPLFMPPADFEERLRILKRGRWNVLPLGEAVQRMYAGELPERSVAITFDDGNYDVYRMACPLLREYGFPATIYLTTYYSEHDLPVWVPFCGYLLWKRRGELLRTRELTGSELEMDLRTELGHQRALTALVAHAEAHDLSAGQKDDLARALAGVLGLDREEVDRRRILRIMRPGEAAELACDPLFDIELHTHRHRTPLDAALFRREIEDNRERIERFTGHTPSHFCYPSGVHRPEFAGWLAELGVTSGTTCQTGIASTDANPWRLPRMIDHSGLSPLEFEGWLTGVSEWLPRRRIFIDGVDRNGKPVLRPEYLHA